MGYIRHDGVIVVIHDYDEFGLDMEKAIRTLREQMPDNLRPLLVGPIRCPYNSAATYAWLPDNSKEGWPESEEADRFRGQFLAAIQLTHYPAGVAINFGGDDDHMVSIARLWGREE